MTFWLNKKLIRENRWFKVFEMQAGVQARVSKFMTDELTIRATELKDEWVSWSESERLAFAQAFSVKREITREDEEILDFIIHNGDELLWSSIASCLTRHSNKKMVLRFLTDRLSSRLESRANFLHALSMLGDREAIPAVKVLHDRLAIDLFKQGARANDWLILDFVVSCSTLNTLEDTKAYCQEIEPFLNHPNEHVRKSCKIWYDGGPQARSR